MAITSVGTCGVNGTSGAGTSFTLTTTTNALSNSGDIGFLIVVSDNVSTTDGQTNDHTSVTGGNGVWDKIDEQTNTVGGAAGDGVCVSLWRFRSTGANAIGTVFTINHNSTGDRCAAMWKFTVAAGANLVRSTAPNRYNTDAGNGFGSSSFSSLPNISRLYLMVGGKEANSTTALTPSANFTEFAGTRSRNNAAAVIVRGEFRINTSTGETSNPTLAVTGDTAAIFAALEESSTGSPSISPSASVSLSPSPSASQSPSPSESPSISPSSSVSPSSSESSSLSPSSSESPSSSVSLSLSPSASASPSSSESPSVSPSASQSPSSSASPSVSPSSSISPSSSVSPSLSPSASISPSPSTSPSSSASPSPPPPPPDITWLDPGGDAVQAVGYFNTLVTGDVSFDTSQKVVGVGSWKCDSGDGTPGTAYVKVPGVLALGGGDNSRRISFYWRYDSVPDASEIVAHFPDSNGTAYSAGGFTASAGALGSDNGTYATATPAKNSGQGNTLSFGLDGAIPPPAVIDSVKITYERKYDVNTSIGISRVKWRVDGVEGPNHDNTDQPLTDTVVEVDVTGERGWTPPDFASGVFEVIAEARRGDTDTSHTQSWDYVKVEVVYHLPAGILAAAAPLSGSIGFQIAVTPKGAGVALKFVPGIAAGYGYDGITQLVPDTDYRITLAYVLHGADDLDIKVYVNSVEELSIEGASTDGESTLSDLLYGWLGSPGASHLCWFDQIYIDDGDDLSDPGNRLMTAKLAATVNDNEWDTAGGTGAVNERPVSVTNYKQHAASSLARQSYTLQAASVGDVDISGETIVGYMGWAWCALQSDDFDMALLLLNGTDGESRLDVSTNPAQPSLLTRGVTSSSYPSNAAGIGMSYQGLADAFLYESGTVVCYEGPPEEILFAEYLLLENFSAEVFDDLRTVLPDTYLLRYWVGEQGGTVTIRVYSISAEGESFQLRTSIQSGAGSGLAHINAPGIELRILMEVANADTFVTLQHYFNV